MTSKMSREKDLLKDRSLKAIAV